MPSMTFYWIKIESKSHHFRRIALHTLDEYPTDWVHLKMMLEELMDTLYIEYDFDSNREEALISLEKHLPGRSFRSTRIPFSKIPYQREYEAIFKLKYNPRIRQITLEDAQFSHTMFYMREDYWRLERDIQWRSPPLIPREHQNIEANPKTILMEPTPLRFVSYSRDPKLAYDKNPSSRGYNKNPRLVYNRRRETV